jgi:hypothetical protein
MSASEGAELSIAVHLSIDAARNAAPWTNNDTALILFDAQQMHAGARRQGLVACGAAATLVFAGLLTFHADVAERWPAR